MPLLLVSYLGIDDQFRGSQTTLTPVKVAMEALGLLIVAGYALGRIFTILEAIRSSFFQPPEAFISTWAGHFPHIG